MKAKLCFPFTSFSGSLSDKSNVHYRHSNGVEILQKSREKAEILTPSQRWIQQAYRTVSNQWTLMTAESRALWYDAATTESWRKLLQNPTLTGLEMYREIALHAYNGERALLTNVPSTDPGNRLTGPITFAWSVSRNRLETSVALTHPGVRDLWLMFRLSRPLDHGSYSWRDGNLKMIRKPELQQQGAKVLTTSPSTNAWINLYYTYVGGDWIQWECKVFSLDWLPISTDQGTSQIVGIV